MRVKYAVTFEFLSRPLVCHRGEVDGREPGTCMSRAIAEAKQALKPNHWISAMCLIDRLEGEDDQ